MKSSQPAISKKLIETHLDLLPYVRWDRFILWGRKIESGVTVYGWIDREDQYKDWVCLHFDIDGDVNYETSSARYSLDIFKRLNNGDGRGHRRCKRVEHFFKARRAIKL